MIPRIRPAGYSQVAHQRVRSQHAIKRNVALASAFSRSSRSKFPLEWCDYTQGRSKPDYNVQERGLRIQVYDYFSQCPQQACGYINGHPFYFRERHDQWEVEIYDRSNPENQIGGTGGEYNGEPILDLVTAAAREFLSTRAAVEGPRRERTAIAGPHTGDLVKGGGAELAQPDRQRTLAVPKSAKPIINTAILTSTDVTHAIVRRLQLIELGVSARYRFLPASEGDKPQAKSKRDQKMLPIPIGSTGKTISLKAVQDLLDIAYYFVRDLMVANTRFGEGAVCPIGDVDIFDTKNRTWKAGFRFAEIVEPNNPDAVARELARRLEVQIDLRNQALRLDPFDPRSFGPKFLEAVRIFTEFEITMGSVRSKVTSICADPAKTEYYLPKGAVVTLSDMEARSHALIRRAMFPPHISQAGPTDISVPFDEYRTRLEQDAEDAIPLFRALINKVQEEFIKSWDKE